MSMINVFNDVRVAESLTILSSVLSKTDLKSGYLIINEDNTINCICYNSIIVSSCLLSCIPGLAIIVDLEKTILYQESLETPDNNAYIPINDFNIIRSIYEYQNTYFKSELKNILHFENINMDENFKDLLSLKSEEGAKWFKTEINGYWICIPVFTGFPKVSKSDKLDLDVYDCGYRYKIIKYTIFKKKLKRSISIVFRTMNLI